MFLQHQLPLNLIKVRLLRLVIARVTRVHSRLPCTCYLYFNLNAKENGLADVDLAYKLTLSQIKHTKND